MTVAESSGSPDPDGTKNFRRMAVVVGTGIFITGLGWPGLIGRLPFGLLLKNQLHVPPEKVAAFWAVATLAWYAKPLIGLLCDAFPLFGTRRRGYLLLGSAGAALAWAAFAVVPRAYLPFMVLMTALNIGLVIVSATVGGMLVEQGQRHGATGRLSAMHTGLEGVMSLVAGPVGGVLATAAFGLTAGVGALIVGAMIPVTLRLFHEPRGAPVDRAVLSAAGAHVRRIVRSRNMWMASALLFLVYLAPGLQTPLLFYQQDVLKLDARFMGILQFAGGVGTLAGSAVYIWLCRRLPLRVTLVVGIVLFAGAALFYLGYRSARAALIIDTAVGFLGALGTLPLYDLAARATPKGSESFGYALMMSVRNIAVFAISDVVGSMLYGRFHIGFDKLVWINAGSTAAVLLFVPFLPRALLAEREGRRAKSP